MSLYRGGRAVKAVYRGSRAVKKIYRGNRLVYQAGGGEVLTVRDTYSTASGVYGFAEQSGTGGVSYTWAEGTSTLSIDDYEAADKPKEEVSA